MIQLIIEYEGKTTLKVKVRHDFIDLQQHISEMRKDMSMSRIFYAFLCWLRCQRGYL